MAMRVMPIAPAFIVMQEGPGITPPGNVAPQTGARVLVDTTSGSPATAGG
jgi:hypothetical protein